MKLVLLNLLILVLCSCGQDAEYENYNYQAGDNVSLTRDNHIDGWTRLECFACHVKANIHKYDVLNVGPGQMEQARSSNSWYGGDGAIGCVTCHGTNGLDNGIYE